MKKGNIFIGRNIRPGMVPGCFSPGCSFLNDMPPKQRHRDERWLKHQEVVEAANRVLEKRMPSVVAETFMKESTT